MWYLYLLETAGGQFYCGITTDVARRYQEHCQQGPKTARFLRGKQPLTLRYSVDVGDQSLALQAEYRVKRWPVAKKKRLVMNQWCRRQLLHECRLDNE